MSTYVKLLFLMFYASFGDGSFRKTFTERSSGLVLSKIDENITTRCEELGVLVVTGYNVKLSDVIKSNGKIGDFCMKGTDVKALKFFVLSTITIDQDLVVNGYELEMSVIAPTWEVLGARNIVLDGYKGKSLPKAQDGVDARDLDGRSGEEGNPGGPGGNFFGVGEKFINGKNLTISVNGGNGGEGQLGGDGLQGRKQEVVLSSLNHCYCNVSNPCKDGKVLGKDTEGNYEMYDCKSEPLKRLPVSQDIFVSTTVRYKEILSITVQQEKSTNGGNGGDGGVGGKMGLPGKIFIFEINGEGNSKIVRQSNLGNVGENGFGGRKGISGGKGKSLLYEVTCYYQGFVEKSKVYKNPDCLTKNGGDWMSKPGKDGKSGKSTIGPKTPSLPKTFGQNELIVILNEYKSYGRDIINYNDKQINKAEVFGLLKRLEDDKNIKKLYNTVGFYTDLKSLEAQFAKETRRIDFYPFYKWLLLRVKEFVQTSQDIKNSTEHKKVLSFIYTATLGRMFNSVNQSDSNVVLDVTEYVSTISDRFRNIEKTGVFNSTLNLIRMYMLSYELFTKTKIKEVQNYISNEVVDERNELYKATLNEINDLAKKVVNLSTENNEENKDLKETKASLKQAIIKETVCSSVNFLVKVLNCLPVVGMAVVTLAQNESAVIEPLLLSDPSTTEPKKSNLTEVFEDLIQTLENITTTEETSVYNRNYQQINKKINTNKKNSEFIPPNKVNTFEKQLMSKSDFKSIQKSKQSKRRKFEKEKQSLNLRANSNFNAFIFLSSLSNNRFATCVHRDRKQFRTRKTLGNIKPQLLQIIPEVALEADEAELDAIEKIKNEIKSELVIFEQVESKIKSILSHLIKNIVGDVKEAINAEEKGYIHKVDVDKWNIQHVLSNTWLQVKQINKNIAPNLMENVKDAFYLLINMYNHINSYRNLKKLEDHHYDVSSSGAQNITIEDNSLLSAANHLDSTIKTNLLLQLYNIVYYTFKSFVFPFAKHNINFLLHPSNFYLGEKVEDFLPKTISQLQVIEACFDAYQNQMDEVDQHTSKGDFDSKSNDTRPFYIWSNEDYKEMISKLLSGQEVTVRAPIEKTQIPVDAVKFNRIEITFKHNNESEQENLKKMFYDYKINATHSGYCFYRYSDKFYLMTTNTKSIVYCYKTLRKKKQPKCKEGDYVEIENGKYFLSPYTFWKLQLINIKKKPPYKDLEPLKGHVDLELAGYAAFIYQWSEKELDAEIDNYYKSDTIGNG